MREVAKSAFSFSWALSLLGIEQAVNIFRPGQQGKGDVFGPITQVAVNQLDDSLKGMYRFGDNLQKQMFDMTLSLMNPSTLSKMNPFGPKGPGQTGQAASPSPDGQSADATQGCCA
jgi:hypothetical protein